MADISSYKRDAKAFADGEWQRPDLDDDLEIKTRGFTDAYADAQARRQRSAAKANGGDVDKLPQALKRKINVECLIDHCLLDVRGLTASGTPVDFSGFCDLLRDGDHPALVAAAFSAAAMSSDARAADTKDAVGN